MARNQKINANVNHMYDKWEKEQFPSRVVKVDADPTSVQSVKKLYGVRGDVARHMSKKIREAKGD